MKFIPFSFLAILTITFFAGCGQKTFRATSGSMANTIPVGTMFLKINKSDYERGDVVIFLHPGPDYSKKPDENGRYDTVISHRIYRLVAFSGDTLQIRNGEVYVNGKMQPRPPKGILQYRLYSPYKYLEMPEPFNSYAELRMEENPACCIYSTSLSPEDAGTFLKNNKMVDSFTRILQPPYPGSDSLYALPCGIQLSSIDNYGPVYIPRPGETINLQPCNRRLYQNINGIKKVPDGPFTITEKLYFVIGDNWYGAEDSRYIGFISHERMEGIASIK